MNPIIILHGALGSATQLDPVKGILKNEGFEVYSLNFSGHGGEPFQHNFGIECFTDDVVRYLEVHHLNQVNIFGYSMGGYVATWLGHQYPNRVGKIITLGTKFDWSVESAAKEVRKLNADKIIEKIPAFARILENRHAPNDWKVLLQRTSEMMLALGQTPLLTKEILQGMQHQTLICLGDQDDMADRGYSEQVASFIPKGTFQLLENTAHPIEKVELNKVKDMVNRVFRNPIE